MHPGLKATMVAGALSALVALPASGQAAKVHGCGHAGKAYSVQGTIVDGGTLVRVAGASTKRTADDRFSGTLVVNVTQASRARDLGPAAYVVTAIRLKGGKAAPAVGTKASLIGTSLSATAARRCGVQEPTGTSASTDSSEGTPAVVTGVTIRLVKLGGKGSTSSPGGSDGASADDTSSDDTSSDDPSVATDPAATEDDGASDDPSVGDDDSSDDSGNASADGSDPATTTPQPSSPAATTPAPSAPIVSLPIRRRH